MQDYEKLGSFYLGRLYDFDRRAAQSDLLLYESKDLTTHAVCVGMTGSGKTGLCLGLLEEAAIDGIPAIVIDPKGDMGNLLLTFPELRPEDFRPWVDPGEATRNGMTLEQYAANTAKTWREGLASWGQSPERIANFRSAVDLSIYTPGSNAGLPLSLLGSFSAPPAAIVDDADALRERITSAVSGLMALLDIDADPIHSREHILMATILDRAWREGRNLDMGSLLREIQSPPFDKVGFLDLETFFPAKDRFALSVRLNNLLASPGFSAWTEGEPLDVQRLLHTPEGKPRVSILSISHLSDAERMFFVTLLLSEVVSWMRSQPGTSSLRALLYMDEVFGYFPPTANPPSKQPMLTLMKQARAFGLGVVLATQNPVDLDYKGLSNAGTWFLGRLQTERDKLRVLEGLEGASAEAGSEFDRGRMEKTLAGLGKRIFLMNNVHEDRPVVFQTRWALSYLRGPLRREQIRTLMADRKQATTSNAPTATQPAMRESMPKSTVSAAASATQRPVVPPGVSECFLPVHGSLGNGKLVYRPALLGSARLHFVRSTAKVDLWKEVALLLPLRNGVPDRLWQDADLLIGGEPHVLDKPESDARFADLPAEAVNAKNYKKWKSELIDHFYQNNNLVLWKSVKPKATSTPDETEGDFRIRLAQLAHEQRDLSIEKLRKRYAPKVASLEEQIRKAEARVSREKSQAKSQMFQTAISFGSTILGGLFGRKIASVTGAGRAASAMRSASRAMRERSDIGRAEESVEALEARLENLDDELQEELQELRDEANPSTIELTPYPIRNRKSDISVNRAELVWTPWCVDSTGIAEPVYNIETAEQTTSK